MIKIESKNCQASCEVSGTINEITTDYACATLIMYKYLLELDAEAAQLYIDFLGEFANDPGGFVAKYTEE